MARTSRPSTGRSSTPSPSQATASKAKKPVKSSSSSKKLWSGRFTEHTHPLVERFTASLLFDRRLYPYDIQGSIAHSRTLERAKVFTKQESAAIIRGLKQIRTEIDQGQLVFHEEDEDIHMSIERRLTNLIGPLGGKLHTGRSRNDQVSLDLRLYVKDALHQLINEIRNLQQSLVAQARKHLSVIMPGYTHLQRAQPVLLSHHFLAYVEMLERDKGRMTDALKRVDVMPLGSGALAGTNYPVDRRFTAKLLGFSRITTNSLDAVSDRDFVVEVLSALSIVMVHLSRLSEELILWSSQEFQFIELPDSFCTGSSMMPQKKNPDVAELVRGKTGRVFGDLQATLTMLKGLPLSYNRDLQEDKEPLFDGLDTARASVQIYREFIKHVTIRPDSLSKAARTGGLLATELADYLVRKGVPFRESHAVVGQLVGDCLGQQKDLTQLTFQEFQQYSPHFGSDVLTILTAERAIARKAQIGGTARKQVLKQLNALEKRLAR